MLVYKLSGCGFKSRCSHEAGRLVPDHSFLFRKAFYDGKTSGRPRLGYAMKTSCMKHQIISPEILYFNFLIKDLGLVSPPYFVYDFPKKNISHAIFNKMNVFHYRLPLPLEISDNICIV